MMRYATSMNLSCIEASSSLFSRSYQRRIKQCANSYFACNNHFRPSSCLFQARKIGESSGVVSLDTGKRESSLAFQRQNFFVQKRRQSLRSKAAQRFLQILNAGRSDVSVRQPDNESHIFFLNAEDGAMSIVSEFICNLSYDNVLPKFICMSDALRMHQLKSGRIPSPDDGHECANRRRPTGVNRTPRDQIHTPPYRNKCANKHDHSHSGNADSFPSLLTHVAPLKLEGIVT